MYTQDIDKRSVDDAGKYIPGILQYVYGDEKVIYVDGWNGLGAVPVLRFIAQELQSSTKDDPPEFCFDKIIYVDCSVWESRRVMQRKVAVELNLDQTALKMLDTQDENDDFDGVDPSSRDVVQSVAACW